MTPFELDQWRETVAERCELPVSALAYLDDADEIRAVARYLVRVRVWEAERRFWRRAVALAFCVGAVDGFLAALGYWPLMLAVGLGAGAVGWRLGAAVARAHRGRWWLERAQPSRAPWRLRGPLDLGAASGAMTVDEAHAVADGEEPHGVGPDWRINAPGPSRPGPGPDVPPGRPRPGPGPDVPLNRLKDLWLAWGDALTATEAARDANAADPSAESLQRWRQAMDRANAVRAAFREAERSMLRKDGA